MAPIPHLWPWTFSAAATITLFLPEAPQPAVPALLLLFLVFLHRRPFALALVPPVAGVFWSLLAVDAGLARRLPGALAGRDLELTGVITSSVTRRGDALRFEFLAQAGEGGLLRPLRARVSWYSAPLEPAPGERWRLPLRLRAPRGNANPGGFDYAGWLFRADLHATGYVRASGASVRVGQMVCCSILRLREHIAAALAQAAADSPQRGLIVALAVGLRDGITPAQREVLRATGTGHLMAISGLHIGLVATLVFGAVARLGASCGLARHGRPVMELAAGLGLSAAIVYALLAGFSIPTRRALTMLCLVLGGTLLRRPLRGGHVLGVSLAVVLLLDPLSPLDPGLWLSFGAVAAISAGLHWAASHKARWLRTQWSVFLGLCPLSLWFFGGLAWLSPAINLLVIPVFGFVVIPAILLAVVLVFAWPAAAQWALLPALFALDIIWQFLTRVAEHPAVLLSLVPRPTWMLALLLPAAALFLAPRGLPGRWLAAIFCIPLLAYRPAAPPHGGVELTVLDVGQGLAAVIRTRRHALIYDTGPTYRGGGSAASSVVLPFLEHIGVRRPDLMILSHGDDDHAGGASTLRTAFPGMAVLGGGRQPDIIPCLAGQAWHWDGVDFAVLHPRRGHVWPGNDGSCVLLVSVGPFRVLVPGDIERDGERGLIASGGLPAVDIVVAPHHGSKTSSSAEFVSATDAGFVVFATGFDNRWGFPRPEVIRRWQESGACTVDTATGGAIRFELDRQTGVSGPGVYRWPARRAWQPREAGPAAVFGPSCN